MTALARRMHKLEGGDAAVWVCVWAPGGWPFGKIAEAGRSLAVEHGFSRRLVVIPLPRENLASVTLHSVGPDTEHLLEFLGIKAEKGRQLRIARQRARGVPPDATGDERHERGALCAR